MQAVLYLAFASVVIAQECCSRIVIDDRLLKSRGAGIYSRTGSLNGKALYQQEEGGSDDSANYIYFNGEQYVIGEQRVSNNLLYEADGYRRTFMRTFQNEATLDDGTVSSCPTDLAEWSIRIPFSTMWTYASENSAIQCEEGSYDQPFDAESAGVVYGPGGTSILSSGKSDIPEDSPFLPSNMVLTNSDEDLGIDPLTYEFAFNEDKYLALAEQCCSTLIVTGTKSVDGLYFKEENELFNGRAAYKNRYEDMFVSHDRTSFTIYSVDDAEVEVKSDENDGYQVCPELVTTWMEATETGYLANRYIETQCYYPRLLSTTSLSERLSNADTIPMAMVRFFSNADTDETHNKDWAAFMAVFYNDLSEYNIKMSVHQVDCDRDPVPSCLEDLPVIKTFDHNVTLTTFNEDFETIEEYLARTVREKEPHKPPQQCCDTIRFAGHTTTEYNGDYDKTQNAVQGKVLYKQQIGDGTEGTTLQETAHFIYYNDSKYCVGADPEIDCAENRILSSTDVDQIICPQDIQTFTQLTENVTIECVYDWHGHTTSEKLQDEMTDPLKLFVVRFFDMGRESKQTHPVWNDIFIELGENPLYSSFVPYQIRCDANATERFYCDLNKIEEMPEILVFREGTIVGYFSQLNDIDEFTYQGILDFFDTLGHVNPLGIESEKPSTNIFACCEAINVKGRGLVGNEQGIFERQAETKFGHVHYLHHNGGNEIYFEKGEFNVGAPFGSGGADGEGQRIIIRSSSDMKKVQKYIGERLGRSVCPSELEHWKYRPSDEEDYEHDRNIRLECVGGDALELMLAIGTSYVTYDVPAQVRNITFNETDPLNVTIVTEVVNITRRSADDIEAQIAISPRTRRASAQDCIVHKSIEIAVKPSNLARQINGRYDLRMDGDTVLEINGRPIYDQMTVQRSDGKSMSGGTNVLFYASNKDIKGTLAGSALGSGALFQSEFGLEYPSWVLGIKGASGSSTNLLSKQIGKRVVIGGKTYSAYHHLNDYRIFLKYTDDPAPVQCPGAIAPTDQKWEIRESADEVKTRWTKWKALKPGAWSLTWKARSLPSFDIDEAAEAQALRKRLPDNQNCNPQAYEEMKQVIADTLANDPSVEPKKICEPTEDTIGKSGLDKTINVELKNPQELAGNAREINGLYELTETIMNCHPEYKAKTCNSVSCNHIYYCTTDKCGFEGWALGKKTKSSGPFWGGSNRENVYAKNKNLRLFLRVKEGSLQIKTKCPGDIGGGNMKFQQDEGKQISDQWEVRQIIDKQDRSSYQWVAVNNLVWEGDNGEFKATFGDPANPRGLGQYNGAFGTGGDPTSLGGGINAIAGSTVDGYNDNFRLDAPTTKAPFAPTFDGALTDALFADTMAKLDRLSDRMAERMEAFDKSFDENVELQMAAAEKDLAWLSSPFQPMELDMNPGAAYNKDGKLIQAPEITIDITDPGQDGIVGDWGEGLGPSKKPVLKSTSLGKMMINDCYRSNRFTDHLGTVQVTIDPNWYNPTANTRHHAVSDIRVKQKNNDDRFFQENDNQGFLYDPNTYKQQSVGDEVSCPIADSILNVCNDIIDAAQYIGVTFDIRKGYNTEGYRSQIVKLWCSWQKKFANNKFDVPDFMHVQGVYETSMKTQAFNTIDEYAEVISQKSNAKVGSAAFGEDTAKLRASQTESSSQKVDAAFGAPVIALESSTGATQDSSGSQQLNTFSRSESNNKQNSMNERKSKSVKKTETMIAEMKIEIMRYQAFMDEPLPAYLTDEFLDDFKILPTSFYSPDAPEKFQDFIERWGTHVVKSVMLGAKFSMKRTTKNDGSVKIDDFQRETQNEFERVTASSYGKKTQEKASRDFGTANSVSGGSSTGSISGSASVGVKDISQNDANEQTTNDATAAQAAAQNQAAAGITSDKTNVKFDSVQIDVEGGSHLIAATLADLYSPTFKKDLSGWLQSVPKYPKPFNFHFQPLSEMLQGLTRKFIEDEKEEEKLGNVPCRKQCFEQTTVSKNNDLTETGVSDPSLGENSGSDFCIKKKKNLYNCKESWVANNAVCHQQCAAQGGEGGTCEVMEQQKIPCLKMLLEEQKWKRRVDALDTAIDIYVQKGYLHNDKNVFVRQGAKLCTTDYEGDSVGDDLFDSEMEVWEQDAVYPIKIQFNFKEDYFVPPIALERTSPELRIEQNAEFYFRFDGVHRMWYTLEDPDDVIIPEMDSAPFTSKQVKSTEVEHIQDNGHRVKHILKVPTLTEVRLRHGLFVTVDLTTATKSIKFTPENLARMKASEDTEVVTFLETHETILESLAATGVEIGFYESLRPKPQKTPVPCLASWALTQQFETTPYLQQCVKMTVKAPNEYFFIMTERISDKHAWIYVHQQRESLCLHRLDRNGREDELAVCADDLAEMEELSDDTEMYVCTNYLRDERKLRIQVGRPNYNSRDLDSATIIISASIIIDELNNEGPPRYYAIASGQDPVLVRQIYVTSLDRVTCAGKYHRVETERSTGNYQSCDMQCHEECLGGCNQPYDARACMDCAHDKFFYSESRFECVSSCNSTDMAEMVLEQEPNLRTIRTGNATFDETVWAAAPDDWVPRWMDGPFTCRICHVECKYGCTGLTDKDCIQPDIATDPQNKGCKTVQYEFEFGRCVPRCPAGNFIGTYDTVNDEGDLTGSTISQCNACHEACQECLENVPADVSQYDGYNSCCGTLCSGGYYRYDTGLLKIGCVRICPKNYYPTDDGECVQKWTVIGYQDTRINTTAYTRFALTHNLKEEPLVNFFDLQLLTDSDSTFKHPTDNNWKLKLEWELENDVLAELIWYQTFAPDSDATFDIATAYTSDNSIVDIESFNQITCSDSAAPGERKLDLSYSAHWRDCASAKNKAALVADADTTTVLFAHFKGLKIKKDTTNGDRTQFPVVVTSPEGEFFGFGFDYMYKEYLFPAFIIPDSNNLEYEYATKVRLSVFDTRRDPVLTQWSDWTGCQDANNVDYCGDEVPMTRTRSCNCNTEPCFPCAGLEGVIDPGTTETEDGICPSVRCEYGDWSDYGNCAYHSSCCQTVYVTGENGQDGYYSKIYVDERPTVIYMNVGTTGTNKYIHYAEVSDGSGGYIKQWILSSNYWDEPTRTIYNRADGESAITESCPNNMISWTLADGSSTNMEVSCSDEAPIQCPTEHPFAYDSGRKCCANPFEDINDQVGRQCDGSPIGLESTCCLNAEQTGQTDQTIDCQTTTGCLNNALATTAVENSFNYPINSDLYYKYSHRACTGTNTGQCGDNIDLSKFILCPNWLEWENWGPCGTGAIREIKNDQDTDLWFKSYNRTRVRNCNTGNQEDCLGEPGLSEIVHEEQICVHWMEWSVWTSFKMVNDNSKDASCYKGKRSRYRQCSADGDANGIENCDPAAETCTIVNQYPVAYEIDPVTGVAAVPAVLIPRPCHVDEAADHITFEGEYNEATGREMQWEIKTELETDLISPCTWEEWNSRHSDNDFLELSAVTDDNNPDGWLSDCGKHLEEIGTRQRIKSCRDAAGTDEGQPLCKINVQDLERTTDHTLQCVGPSELVGTDVKYCQKLIEREPIFCPYWTQWTSCSATCSWVANRDKYRHMSTTTGVGSTVYKPCSGAPPSGTKYDGDLQKSFTQAEAALLTEWPCSYENVIPGIQHSITRYRAHERNEFTELPGSERQNAAGFRFSELSATQLITDLPAEFQKATGISFIRRRCVIGPNGLQNDVPVHMWYLCQRKSNTDFSTGTAWSIGGAKAVTKAERPTNAYLDALIFTTTTFDAQTGVATFVEDTQGDHPDIQQRCGFRPCPSWSEWRSGFQTNTIGGPQETYGTDGELASYTAASSDKGYTYPSAVDDRGNTDDIVNALAAMTTGYGDTKHRGLREGKHHDFLGCRNDYNQPYSMWERECLEFGDDGGEPKSSCVGTSREIREDCPMWSEWTLNINVCGHSPYALINPGRPPATSNAACLSRITAHYWDYRYCRMAGKANGKNPRDGEDFEKDAKQAVSIDSSDGFTAIPWDYPNNEYCNSAGSKHVVDVDVRARTEVYCGITPEEFWDCHDREVWEAKEDKRWILIAAAIAGLVILHAILPFHFIPFFGR